MLNVADSPLARMRMSPWACAYLIQQQVGLETILHFPTRGRNLLRVQGDLLASHALGVRNLFVVMGDPPQIGDYPEASDAQDLVPSGLLRLVTVWPFPEAMIREIAGRVKGFVTVEINLGQIHYEVERCAGGKAKALLVGSAGGKIIHPDKVIARIQKEF